MEGMLAKIKDTLGCSDTQTTVSIIITLSGDQATQRKLNEDLDAEEKMSVELQDKVTKLEESKYMLLKKEQ